MPIRNRWLALILFLLSGATGLVYEVVWTRQLIFLLGGTTYAITTVLVAFMSGLALGSWLSGRLGGRMRRPGQGYAILEIAIGLYALAVPVLLGVADPLYRTLYPHVADLPWVLTAVRFCVGALVLLIPSTCMGATLPMLVRYLSRGSDGLGRSTGMLYGINTCGAVVGTLLAGFVLIPNLGLQSTTWATAAINVLIGLVALLVLREQRLEMPAVAKIDDKPAAKRKPAKKQREALLEGEVITKDVRQTVLVVAGLSGFAAMVYQIAWTRALIMSLGSSTYAFTCILAAFILGLGVGSLVISRWVDRWSRPVLLLALMEMGIGLSAIFIMPIHGYLPVVVNDLVANRRGDYNSLLAAEFALVIAVTFVPTLLMGAIFPLVVRLVGTSGQESGSAVGQAYAINTLGTIIGSFLAGFVMIRGDMLGIQNSIVAAATLNAIAAGWLLTKSGRRGELVKPHAAIGGAGLCAVLILGTTTGGWHKELMTSAPYLQRGIINFDDREILYFFEDVDTTVSVERIGGEQGSLTLSVNGKPDASTGPADVRTQLLVGHLPALMDRGGRKACVIGLGSGMTLSAVARYPSYELIDCVELSEGVIEAAEFFSPYIHDVLHSDPRVRMLRADGRNHLLLTDQRYDLIVSQPSNPWLAGVSNLFTREYFELCRSRLTPDGVFAGWMQSYSTSEDSFKLVIRTMLEVFDTVTVWEAGLNDYCMIAWNGARTVNLEDIRARFEQPPVREDLYRVSIRELGRLLGNYVSGGEKLRKWVEGAPVHTDDNAILEFRAPRDLYRYQQLQIGAALVSIQESPLGTLIETPATQPPGAAEGSADLESKISRSLEARRQRVSAMLAREKAPWGKGFEALIEAYESDPGNFLLFMAIMAASERLDEMANIQGHPAARLVERVDSLAVPTIAPPQGASSEEMIGIIAMEADSAVAAQNWEAASVYLEQAREVNPNDPRIAEMQEKIENR